VNLAKAAGFALTTHRVHNIRWAAKRKGKVKKSKLLPAAAKIRPRKVRRVAPRAAARPAPWRTTPTPGVGGGPISAIDQRDLAYAVGRLVADGKTTALEIMRLAAERTARIMALETELASLKGGQVPAGARPERLKATKSRKAARKPAARMKTIKAKATKGKVSTRSDGRRFTMTAKALAARKVQGQYLGHLRQVPADEKPRFKAIARDKGVAVAVSELKKRLGKA